MKIALVTCLEMPDADEDEGLLLEALRAAGAQASLVAWDDREVDPATFDAMILRSTWNYHLHLESFLAWASEASRVTALSNPPEVLKHNAHKRYLLEYEAQGIGVVPTALISKGDCVDLGALCAQRGWTEVVIKPAVSGGSFETHRFDGQDWPSAQAIFERILRERDVVAQPYMPAFQDPGEHSLVWIDGAFTHTIHKRPRFANEEESVELVPDDPAELALAERLIAPIADSLLYGRVDLIQGDDGPLLCELELIEPSLFLRQYPPALERLVQAVLECRPRVPRS